FWAKVKTAGKRLQQWLTSYLIGQCPDPLEPQSVSNLLKLTWKYGVKAVLTGHPLLLGGEAHTPSRPFLHDLGAQEQHDAPRAGPGCCPGVLRSRGPPGR
ncbi:MAG: hypothetical protein OK454_10155, partial [Thaumarchaeota archaeon]|nr:hypothetical protein [Nitrososphaerota archaeon]